MLQSFFFFVHLFFLSFCFLIFFFSVVDFADAESFENADLGKCGPLVLPPSTTNMPSTTDLGPLGLFYGLW